MSFQRPPHVFVLLGVLLAIVALCFVLSPSPTAPDSGDAVSQGTASPDENPSLLGHGPGREAPAHDATPVEVEVVDTKSAPIEAAVVRVYAIAHGESSFLWAGSKDPLRPQKHHAEGRTGPDGHVRLDAPPEGCRIAARTGGLAQGLGWAPPADADGARHVRIVLRVAHVLQGRVIDVNGVPVAGVLVSTAQSRMGSSEALRHLPHVVSSKDGSYRLEGLGPGTVLLAVARPGMTLRDAMTVRVPEIAHFDIVLPAATVLRGRVTHEASGNPVVGVVVAARVGNGWDAQRLEARAVTDEDGDYEIPGLPPVRLLEVEVEHETLVQTVSPRETHYREIRLDADRPVVWDLSLRPGSFIAGTVRGMEEIADLQVQAIPRDPPRSRGTSATTGRDGRFRCGPLLGGVYEVRINSWRVAGESAVIDIEDGDSTTVTLTVGPKQEDMPFVDDGSDKRSIAVRGTVRSVDGSVVAGAWIGAQEAGMDSNMQDFPFEWTPLMQVVAGPDGTFELTCDVWTSAFEVIASAPGYAPSRPVVVRLVPDQEQYEADVVLDRGHAIEVTVLDAATSRPVVRAMASLVIPAEHSVHVDYMDGPPPPAVHAVSSEDGRFHIENVRAGAYRLDIAARGYVPTAHPLTVPTASPIEIALQPALDLGGRLVFADGTNPGIAAVRVKAANGGVRRRTRSREDGTFLVRGVPAGKYALSVDQASSSTLNILAETLGPFEAGRRDLVVTVHRGLTIEGRVVGTDGEAVWGATVSADDEDGRSAGHLSWSKKDGTFEMVGLPGGRMRLTVDANGYLSRTTDPVEAGARGVVVTLQRGGWVSGVVVDEEGKPVAGLDIAAVEAETGGYPDYDAPQARTDAEGRFEIKGIKRSKVELVILMNVGMRVLLGAEVVPLNTPDLRVTCAKGATITGIVLDERGRPFAGASLSASPPTYGMMFGAESDAEGRFTLEGLFPDRKYEIEVEWTDAEDESENSLDGFEARGGDEDVEIRLE